MKRLLLATILAVSVALCYGQNFKDQMRGVLSDASKVCLSAATNEWFNKLDQSDKRRIESAINLCNKVEEMANYASNLRELVKNSQIPLPVGIKNDAGYNLVVSEIVHDNDSVATILMSCVIPLKSCILGFEGTFTITGKAGVCSPGKINMIAPVSFGKNIRVVFDKGTYAEFDCEGITKFHANAVVEIDSTNLVFYDERDSITKQVPKFSTSLDFQEVNDFAFSLDQKVKFGFRNLKDWIFTLERIQFNNNWGLNFVQFKGDAVFLSGNEKFGSIVSSANQYIQAVNKANQMTSTDGSQLPIPEIKGSYPLTASTLIKYDNTNKSFFAYLRAYLDLGLIHGKGDNNKLVDATAYFGPDKWYTYLGRPNDRCGIVADLGKLFHLDLNSYFMAGKIDARLPDPDARLKSLFSDSQWQSFQQRKSSPSLDNADGVAFGVGFATGLSVRPWPFFAELNVATGGEFLLANYGKNSHCKGSSSPLGIGGWYASAQLWAYLDAQLGIQVKFLRKTRKFTIFDAAAGAILQGAGPNPFYFTGLVGCKYKVLGGLFKGTCSLKFEIGEPCEIVQEKGLLDQNIIASLTPDNGSSDVNVFVSPQMLLNVDCRNQMALEVDGQKNIYKVFVDYVKVYKFATGEELKGSISIDDEGLVVSFDPETALESETKYKMEAKVTFKQLVNGVWQTAKDPDGSEYVESMQTIFTSGQRPDHIDPDHIICSYPVDRMYNFYPNETTTGYICLDAVFDYLFLNVPEGYEQKLRISTLEGSVQTTSFTHFASNEVTMDSRKERYEISFDLSEISFAPQTIYKLEIVNIPKHIAILNENVSTDFIVNGEDSTRAISADGDLAQLETKQICEINFRTSKFETFEEKVNSINIDGKAVVDGGHIDMKNIFKGFVTDDFFDVFESQVWGKTNTLVHLEADLNNTKWYKESVYKIMYDNYSESQAKRIRGFSYPPADAMTVFNPFAVNHNQLSDTEIQTGIAKGIYDDGMINYGIIFECHEDIEAVQDEISTHRTRDHRLSLIEEKILDYSQPESYVPGNYPFIMSYRLPGKKIVTSEINLVYKY